MIVPLLNRLDPGHAAPADEDRAHYLELLDRLGVAPGVLERPKVLGVTSCRSGEGVSTVAASLAVTAASSGHGPVLLVDANLERPTVYRLVGVKPAPGLAEALQGSPAEPILQPSAVPGLTVLAAGAVETRPARAVAATAFAQLLQSLKNDFALVVVDMAPADRGSMAIQLAAGLDGVLLVVEAERVRGEEIRQCKDALVRARASLLGVVLNKKRRHLPASLERWL